jgi:hypothetical protein
MHAFGCFLTGCRTRALQFRWASLSWGSVSPHTTGVMKPRVGKEWTVVALTALWLSAAVASGLDPEAATEEADAIDPSLPASTTQPDTNAPPATAVQGAKIDLPPELLDVVRLAESGVTEEVIIAYIEKSAALYPLTADQIVYLRDLGMSSQVIQALVAHQPSQPARRAPSVASSPAPPQAPMPDSETDSPPPPTDAEPGAAPPDAAADDYGYYADSLSPYGSWLDLPGYGWCWQPTVVLVNPSWRPYCNDGGWAWSDCGWYWNSSYSWGWAPFHYGRWCRYPRYGWVWRPDRVWGPAWVCWRQGANCCGWAPLPPGARLTAKAGWTFKGTPVSQNTDFGLPKSSFTFVGYQHLTDPHLSGHRLPARQVNAVFNQTAVNNNAAIGTNGRMVNRGIDPRLVTAVSPTPLRQATVRELNMNGRSVRPTTGVPAASGAKAPRAGFQPPTRSPAPTASAPSARSTTATQNRQGSR